jgi:hypothetical protein
MDINYLGNISRHSSRLKIYISRNQLSSKFRRRTLSKNNWKKILWRIKSIFYSESIRFEIDKSSFRNVWSIGWGRCVVLETNTWVKPPTADALIDWLVSNIPTL